MFNSLNYFKIQPNIFKKTCSCLRRWYLSLVLKRNSFQIEFPSRFVCANLFPRLESFSEIPPPLEQFNPPTVIRCNHIREFDERLYEKHY